MILDRLGEAWGQYKSGLEKELRVLVIDDEAVIGKILRELLEEEGFWVETVLDAEEAWRRLESRAYDLLIVDKNLPGRSGLDLIKQVQDAGIDVPSIVITGYASVEGINKALMHGASDYIQKPFHLPKVLHRIKAVIERRVAERVYSLIIHDLSHAVKSSGEDKQMVHAVAVALAAFKAELAERPSVLVVEPTAAVAELTVGAVIMQDLSVAECQTLEQAKAQLQQPAGPLVAVVNLKLGDVGGFIRTVRAQDPQIEFFVTSTGADIESAQAVLEAGAADFFERTVEGIDVLQIRVARLVRRARRQRLYNHLIATLLREAEERDKRAADSLKNIVPEVDWPLIEAGSAAAPALVAPDPAASTPAANTPPAPAAAAAAEPVEPAEPVVELNISEIFDEPVDRRQHPRLPARFKVRLHELREDRTLEGETRDLSLGGMFVMSRSSPGLGSRVLVELLPGGDRGVDSLSVSAEIVRSKPLHGEDEGAFGLGLRVMGQLENYHAVVCRLMDR